MTTDFDICMILREEAQARAVSGNEIARRTGMTQGGIAKILSGRSHRIQVASVIRIVNSLGHDLSWLQDRLNARTQPQPTAPENSNGVPETICPVDTPAS